jgi:hypothetical protein
MVVMILTLCLSGNPSQCVEYTPAFEEPLTMMSCLMSAQVTANKYIEEHPRYMLTTYSCGTGLVTKRDI